MNPIAKTTTEFLLVLEQVTLPFYRWKRLFEDKRLVLIIKPEDTDWFLGRKALSLSWCLCEQSHISVTAFRGLSSKSLLLQTYWAVSSAAVNRHNSSGINDATEFYISWESGSSILAIYLLLSETIAAQAIENTELFQEGSAFQPNVSPVGQDLSSGSSQFQVWKTIWVRQ